LSFATRPAASPERPRLEGVRETNLAYPASPLAFCGLPSREAFVLRQTSLLLGQRAHPREVPLSEIALIDPQVKALPSTAPGPAELVIRA
jgi:hypothetical protein